MAVTIIFLLFLFVIAGSLIVLLARGIKLLSLLIQRKEKNQILVKLKKNLIFLAAVCISCGALVLITQRFAFTPAISGSDGRKLENSIAQLRQVTLNGRKEWISIRGNDKNNPVLLFLAGGPGGSQMAATRHELSRLEKHFVVVNWDQPGSGKSYGAMDIEDITLDTYLEDGYALTKYLCEELGQERIYLIGESWGSALGILLADQAPELYQGVIGTGQMIAFLETEITDYELAMEIALDHGDTKTVNTLRENGYPPYYGKDVTWKSAAYLQYLSSEMMKNPAIKNNGYNTFRDLFSSEYGILDKINYFRGIVTTFNHAYPQLYDIDLRKAYTKLDIPVYFFIGRHDINAPTIFVEEYYSLLEAPKKEIIWFEQSGHSPWLNESKRFTEEAVRLLIGDQ